jgi:hypothetical protein
VAPLIFDKYRQLALDLQMILFAMQGVRKKNVEGLILKGCIIFLFRLKDLFVMRGKNTNLGWDWEPIV